MNEETRPYHPIANIFPMMSEDEYKRLKKDIQHNGLLEPIWLHKNGSIIDGRNRHKACIDLDKKPTFKIYQDGDKGLIGFVVSLNLHRRHLNTSQRAQVAASIEQYTHGGDRQDQNSDLASRDEVSRLLNVSHDTIANASKVKNNGISELGAAVQDGSVSVYAAAQVAELPPSEQIAVTLRGPRAIVEKSKEIREGKRQKRRQERIEKIAMISSGNRPLSAELGRFPVLYADPPWQYEHSQTDSRKIENQYPTMTLEEIEALKVGDVRTDDAILFLWTTAPKLAEAMSVIDAWGFTYRTGMIWDKGKMGMGYYTRVQHEHLLIATCGSIPVPEPAARVRSVYRSDYSGHSVKPEYFHEMIEVMYPRLPKLELFSRNKRDGWASWGNEA